MGEKDEDDLRKALAETPWTAIFLPLIGALLVIVGAIIVTLYQRFNS